MATTLLATEISGLTVSYYNSGSVNKLYVDTISSNLDTKIDAVGGGTSPSSWTAPTAVSGIQLAGVGKISGALSIGVVDYIASANAVNRFADSSNIQSKFLLSGVRYNALSSQSISGGTIRNSDIITTKIIGRKNSDGDIEISLWTSNRIKIYDSPATDDLSIDPGFNTWFSKIYGKDSTQQGGLMLYANPTDNYSYIKLNGSGNILLSGTSVNVSSQLNVGLLDVIGRISSQQGIYTHFISANNTNLLTGASDIESLTDVAEMTPSDNDALVWDNSNSFWSSQVVSTSDVAWSGASGFYTISSSVNPRWVSSNAISSNSLIVNQIDYSYPPLTFTIPNIRISANQALNLGKFITPGTTSAYVLQSYCNNSGNNSIGDLSVQMLSGSTIQYSCSSNTLQQETTFSSSKGNLEFRFTYSGSSNPTGYQWGTGLIQIGVW